MLQFDRYLCLVSDHMGAACRACIDACYKEAFGIKGGRIRFDENLCTACGGCVGGCPTGAMSAEGFDEDHFALIFAQGNQTLLSCRENTPCLAVFGAEHLAVMALRGKKEIVCDLAHCAGCEFNAQNRLLPLIESRMRIASDLLGQLDFKYPIVARKEAASHERRGFFKKLFHTAVKNAVRPESSHRPVDAAVTPIPKRRILLQNTLRDYAEEKLARVDSPLIADRAVSDACTACGDCVRICPTRALGWAENGAALMLENRRCIDCDLCATVCKSAAIARPARADAGTYIDAGKTALRTFVFRECDACGTPFAAGYAITTCRSCSQYAQDFGDMFTPAWKLENS